MTETNRTEHKIPYSEEGEKGVLGSILLEAERVVDLCLQEGLNAEAFYVPAHRTLFLAIGTLVGVGRPVDVLTITEFLRQKNMLDKIGGSKTVDDMITATPTAAHAGHYIDLVKRSWMKRKIHATARDAAQEAFECDEPEELRSKTEQAFTDMASPITRVTVPEVFREMESDIKAGLEGRPTPRTISTGYPGLDRFNEGGIRKGGVYWLTGKEGTGKTSLKCCMITRMLEAGLKIANLTLEMTIRDELEKLTSCYIQQSISRVIRGKDKIDMELVEKAKKLLVESGRLHIVDQSTVNTTTGLWSFARRMVSKNKIDILCVDYFQLLNLADTGKMSMEQQVAEKSKCVKDIAGILQIPVLCVAAINKDGQVRYSRQGDYDGAGHWQLSRATEEEPQPPDFLQTITLYTKKARFGIPFAKLDFKLYGGTGYFEEHYGQERYGESQGSVDTGVSTQDEYAELTDPGA